MARLYRFVKLHDRLDTQIFTFLLPPTLINDAPKDLESKEFMYGNQCWNIHLIKNDKHIGVYLCLRGAHEGLKTTVDFSFTFNNKEHFTKNDTYCERAVLFSHAKTTHGRKNFVSMADMVSRGYAMDNGQFLLALEMRNASNVFQQTVQLPSENSKSYQIGGANRYQKIETSYFPCGNFVWNMAVFPFGDSAEKDGIPMIYLVRQTNFDHHCKVKYKLTIGQGDKVIESDVIEQVFDTSGGGKPYEIRSNFRYNLYALASGKKLFLRIDLITATAISECHLFPRNRENNRSTFYDREKQAWLIESDTSLHYLRFRLYYSDVHNVARRHIRYVGFSLSVVPRRGHYKPIPAMGVPYFQLYPQADTDVEGFDIQTEISVKEINNTGSAILDEQGRLTVHLELIDSIMLFNDQYNKIDEIESRHKHQMAREIMALQAENLSLEKQLHSYQLSIAKTSAKDGLDVPLVDSTLPAPLNGSSNKETRRASSPRVGRSSTPDSRKSTRRERSKDRRRNPAPELSVPVDERQGVFSNGGSSKAPQGRSASANHEYVDPYVDTVGYYDDLPNGPTSSVSNRRYQDTYAQDEYGRDGYRGDYQYYSDKYSNQDYTPNSSTGRQGDPYYTNIPYEDPYNSPQVISPEKYPVADTYASSYGESYGSVPGGVHPPPVVDSRYKVDMDVYPEDISYTRERYSRKLSDGMRKTRDQQSDDGYYSSSTGQFQHGGTVALPDNLSAQQYLPGSLQADERIASSGRRSPSGRRSSSRRSDASVPDIGSHSPGVTRSKSRRDKHKDK